MNENIEHSNIVKKRGIFDPSITEHRGKVSSARPTIQAIESIPFIDMLVPIENNVKIPVRIYVNRKMVNSKRIPTLFYVPGTGFVAAETRFTHATCTNICHTTECQIIVINHRLAPENQCPEGFMDAYKVFKFFTEEAPNRYAIDKEKIAIAGYSSGGNIAALMTIKAMEEGIYVRKQILISPIVDLSRSLTGFEFFEDKDTEISEPFVYWVLGLYIPPEVDRRNPSVSPFWKEERELRRLPSTDIILAEYDRCRADSEYYFYKLKNENVHVEKFIALNENHAYLWHNQKITDKFSERVNIAFRDISLNRNMLNIISYIHTNPENEEQNNIENQTGIFKPKL